MSSYDHLGQMFKAQFSQFGTAPALRYRQGDGWAELSYDQFWDRIERLASAMIRSGIQVGDRVGIYSANRYEWAVTDLACLQVGAISVPIYATNTQEQAAFIVDDAGIRLLFVGNETQLANALASSGCRFCISVNVSPST